MENLDQSNNKNVSLSLIAGYGTDSDSDDTETRSNDNIGNEDSDTSELSEMVLKNNIINACAHGPLSRPADREDAETTRHMIIDSSESGVVEYEVTEYRDIGSDSDSSSSNSSDSEVDSVKDMDEMSSGEDDIVHVGKPETIKVNGELGLDDLPPIEDLAISLPSQETTKIGTIASIVDRLVIVRALPQSPAVDIDSVLFLENGAKALGKVFDVFGPVTEPHYCVRFNSAGHVRARGVQPGADVYIAPDSRTHTSYVLLAQLMKMKGSDASWLHDIEPPPHQVEYSDDEEERRAKKKDKNKQEESENDGESSKKKLDKRIQRPSESSSRFGSGPSRGRNPFRRNPNSFPRFNRPWSGNDMRTPPNGEPGHPPYSAPPFSSIPMFPPPFIPNTPPPFMNNMFQFGGNPRMPPFRHAMMGAPAPYCTMPGAPPQWVNGPPPPPGT